MDVRIRMLHDTLETALRGHCDRSIYDGNSPIGAQWSLVTSCPIAGCKQRTGIFTQEI